MKKIGYLIPEFPGQTHIFYWRELRALQEEGVDCDLVSTRMPPKEIAAHSWAEEAITRTFYLYPVTAGEFASSVLRILLAGPLAWWRCLRSVLVAEADIKQKLRLVALAILSGKLVGHAQKKGWDHIHVTSCADGANVAMFASLISNLTYSLTHLGPSLMTYGPNQPEKWRYTKFAIVESEMLLNMARERLGDLLPKALAVSSMGVDLSQSKRQETFVPWRGVGPIRIFSCGRLNPVKGHDDLVTALKTLRDQGYDVRLEIAGEDEQGGRGYRQELESFIHDKQMDEFVTLLGAVSEDIVQQRLESSHVFALASLNEGTSIAIMEALAMAIPIVVTRVGNTPGMVDDHESALIVEPKDPDAMAAAIREILDDSDLAASLSQNARRAAEEKFCHRNSAKLIANFVREL